MQSDLIRKAKNSRDRRLFLSSAYSYSVSYFHLEIASMKSLSLGCDHESGSEMVITSGNVNRQGPGRLRRMSAEITCCVGNRVC